MRVIIWNMSQLSSVVHADEHELMLIETALRVIQTDPQELKNSLVILS